MPSVRQHASVGRQTVVAQVVPAPWGVPPLLTQLGVGRSSQSPPGRQQASVGRGQLAAAHVLPGPLGVPFKAMQFAAV